MEIITSTQIKKHNFPVWSTAISPTDPSNILITGGDDCSLVLHDLRLESAVA